MLDVKQTEALQAMALTGSLTRAAELLDITPLSMCRILAEVEEEIGHPVLQPYGRTIRLTRVALLFAQKIKPSFDPDSLSPC
ncbi:LysR family transcriptional regulator [Streptomyces sp. NBC_01281]|uniref:helix-turn-helix domain-containing protein n=1 Tax=Streptomyces sp. NBC_01281 TaxID=2903811 RepID=UPI002E11E8D7|nr:LysR family transcriptional regulator [Streptomyces sp. NBC_01281]